MVRLLFNVFAAAAIDLYSLSMERGGVAGKAAWEPGGFKEQKYTSSQQAYRTSFEVLCCACKEKFISYPEDLDLVDLCEALRS